MMMDYVFSLDTHTTNATPSSQPLLPQTLLLPKPEPFWDTHNNTSDELDLFSEFNRLTELFHLAFRATHVVGPFGAQEVPVPQELNPVAQPHLNSPAKDVSRAIIQVSPERLDSTVAVAIVQRRKQSRQKELVRVMDLSPRDEAHLRETVRRTRIIYDSLRVLTSVEEEKRVTSMAATTAVEGSGPPLQANHGVSGEICRLPA